MHGVLVWIGRTCVQVELDVRVLLLLVAVVVRPSLYYLHVAQLYVRIRALRGDEAAECNYRGDGEGDCREEAEDILQAHQCRMHLVGGMWRVRVVLSTAESSRWS